MNLSEILAEINHHKQGADGVQYFVRPIPDYETHYFGRVGTGRPCLLLSSGETMVRTPIRLESVEVNFSSLCKISISNHKEVTEHFTTLVCTSSDQVVHVYFAHICETIVKLVGTAPTLEQVEIAVRRLVDLFQKISTPAKRSVIGVFGELYVIDSALSANSAMQAWKSELDNRYDFSLADVRLEVKASSARQRVHVFSLEQCTPPPDTTGVLISMFVELVGSGISLLDLVNRIELKLENNSELQLKLQETIAEDLGSSLLSAMTMRFDEQLSKSSIQVYDLSSIPAIRENPPPEVSGIKFRSDISRTEPIMTGMISSSDTLRSLLPEWL